MRRQASCLAAALALSSVAVAAAENPEIDMITSLGAMRLRLRPDAAPATVANFLRYVDDERGARVVRGGARGGAFGSRAGHRSPPEPSRRAPRSVGGL